MCTPTGIRHATYKTVLIIIQKGTKQKKLQVSRE